MQVARRRNINNFIKYSSLAVLSVVGLFSSSTSFALLSSAALGVAYSVPQGYAFQTLSPAFGLQGEVLLDSPAFMVQIFKQIHLAATYNPFPVRALAVGNTGTLGLSTTLSVAMIGAFIGVRAESGIFGE